MSEMPKTAIANRRLVQAVQSAQWAAIPALLEEGADPNHVIDRQPLLSRVVFCIDTAPEVPAILAAIVAAGGDINGVGEDGDTPLLSAIMRPRPDLLEWLLLHGADPNQAGGDKVSPLWLATELDLSDETDMRTRLLAKYGASADVAVKLPGRAVQTVREHLKERAGIEQAFSATGIVDMSETAKAARALLAVLDASPPQAPADIQRILRANAQGRRLKISPKPKGNAP